MNSNSFTIASSGFSMYRIMSFAKSDSLTFSFPFSISYFSFTYLIDVARTSKTLLNKSGKSGHPCIVPHLRGNYSTFLPLSMMSTVGLLLMAFIMLR